MGYRTDRLELGSWNVICERCGFKYKQDRLVREWTGLRVCRGQDTNDCWEPRHPQDLRRPPSLPRRLIWTRPEPPDVFIVYDPVSIAITGNQATGATGSVTAALTQSITGNEATGSVGTVGACGPGIEYTLATLDGIGESTFQDARAAIGITDGDTVVEVGLGNWTNTYTHPCAVYVYEYNIATDSYGALVRTLPDILPTVDYSGSVPSIITYDGDVSTFSCTYQGVGVEIVGMYDLDGTIIKSYTWGSAFNGNVIIARRGTDVVIGNRSSNAKALRKWVVSGGLATTTSPSTARIWQTIHIHKDGVYLYGVENGGATVYQYDLATLTEQTSFATPTGSGTAEKLFSHVDSANLWILSTIAGQKKIHERVSGSWVLRHTIVGSFNADSLYNYVNYEDDTLFDFYNAETGGASQVGYKIEPLGCL